MLVNTVPISRIAVGGRRRGILPGQRFRILRRDQYSCRYCGATAPDVALEVDHVIPVIAGGPNTDENLVTACRTCNAGKSDTVPPDRILWSEDQYALAAGELRSAIERLERELMHIEVECEVRYGRAPEITPLDGREN